MATRGQRPTPTSLRLIKGNPSGRPLPKAEPKPGGRPRAPASLTMEQRAVWDEHVAEAFWLTAADGPLAVIFVALYAEFLADPAGMIAARISNLRAAMSSLGFDVSQRARMGVTAPENPDAADKFFD